MSKWCQMCYRTPYRGCDDQCPIFGCSYEDLAKKVLNLIPDKETFVLCMCLTQAEFDRSCPSDLYEMDTLEDCISECVNLVRQHKYFAAYVVASDGSVPYVKIFEKGGYNENQN